MKRSRETEPEGEEPALKKTKLDTELTNSLAERIVAKWKQLQKEDPKFDVVLEAGIEDGDIINWEKKHKVTLPETLKALYRLANGQQGANVPFNEKIGLFGNNMLFAPLDMKPNDSTEYTAFLVEIHEYFKDAVYDIQDESAKPKPKAQGAGRGRQQVSGHYVETNGTVVKLVHALIIACNMQDGQSTHYVLMCYAQRDSSEMLFDVAHFKQADTYDMVPFEGGSIVEGKPSTSRFDDWLMAYEMYLANHMDEFYLSNDPNAEETDNCFSDFHNNEFVPERFQHTKSAAKHTETVQTQLEPKPEAETRASFSDSGLAERIVAKWRQLRKEDGTPHFHLEAGIEEAKITNWETLHKVPLPETLKALYRLANGQQGVSDYRDHEKHPGKSGLFGNFVVFAPLELAKKNLKGYVDGDDSPIFSYAGGLEDLYKYFEAEVYDICDESAPQMPITSGRGKQGRGLGQPSAYRAAYAMINGATVKLVATSIIACALREESSVYYILLCFAQRDHPEILYDVIASNSYNLIPFGMGSSRSRHVITGKPSPTRFDDWLMAYDAHLTDHLEDLHLSNHVDHSYDVDFGKFHEDEFLPGQRSSKTKSAANVFTPPVGSSQINTN